MSREVIERATHAPAEPIRSAPAPSRTLLRAAVSGLLASAAGACGDDSGDDGHEHPAPSNEELTALCKDMVDDAVEKARDEQDVAMLCAPMVTEKVKAAEDKAKTDLEAAESECSDQMAEAMTECDGKIEALEMTCHPLITTADQKMISSETKDYTFEALTEMCDERGGYTQVHAACGGHNACAGFSYGDWGPGASVLTEHSCAGANACLGLSCVQLPEDEDRTGEEVYAFMFGELGPNDCLSCHAPSGDGGHGDKDVHKFIVWQMPDANPVRTVDTWLDRSAAEMERVVAFGANDVLPNGTAYQGMAPYHRALSRAEIERVVAHIRTLEPVFETIKIADP